MANPLPDIWRIEVVVPAHAVDACESALEPFADAVSWFVTEGDADEPDRQWLLQAFSRAAPDRAGLEAALAVTAAALAIDAPVVDIARVPHADWVTDNLRDFPPIAAGRYFVHGSHYEGRVPVGRVGLMVDAGTAFGSGEHATTQGCLLAIDRLARRRRIRHPLDLGCGSAILALAMAHAWPVKVLAADIDPPSVRVASFNARRNGLAGRVRCVISDGYNSRDVHRGRPYDLIVANILANPLTRMAAELSRHLAPGGVAILSGLLRRQERQVLSAHRRHRLSLKARVRIGDWSTLIVGR